MPFGRSVGRLPARSLAVNMIIATMAKGRSVIHDDVLVALFTAPFFSRIKSPRRRWTRQLSFLASSKRKKRAATAYSHGRAALAHIHYEFAPPSPPSSFSSSVFSFFTLLSSFACNLLIFVAKEIALEGRREPGAFFNGAF